MSICSIPELAIYDIIFDYSDLQSLGQLGNVNHYFNELRNDFLKKNPSRYLIPIGTKIPGNQCTLNLRDRTVYFDKSLDTSSFTSVMQNPHVPKGSFLVFPDKLAHTAMIKNKVGVIESVTDNWFYEINLNHPIFIEIRNFQRTKSPFHHVKIVILDPNYTSEAKEPQNKALAWVLEGIGRAEQMRRFNGKQDAAQRNCTLI